MASHQETLETYIYQIARLQKTKTLTSADLINLQKDLGLRSHQIKQIELAFSHYLTEGKTANVRKDYSQAITSLEKALQINPIDETVLVEIARAHWLKFKALHNEFDKNMKNHYLHLCLSLKPDHEDALALFNEEEFIEESEKKSFLSKIKKLFGGSK